MVPTPFNSLFPSAARLGWLTTRSDNPPLPRAAVYFLRGQAVVFSRGFGRLCDRLREMGCFAEDLRCVGHTWVVQHITSHPRVPIVLVGHSRGGRGSIAAANRLARLGAAVELLLGIDVAFPAAVPANVRRAVHLFRTRRRIYPARPFQAAPGFTGVLQNVDLDQPGAPFDGRGLHHLNITSSPLVQEWIVEQVRQRLRL